MKNLAFVLALLSWACISDAARILAVMSIWAPSHHIWFSSLTGELAARGHEVYSIDFQIPKRYPPTLNVSVLTPLNQSTKAENAALFKTFREGTTSEKFRLFVEKALSTCEEVLKDKCLQDIISPDFKQKFDVIILNYAWHECMFGLIHRFNNTPTIVASPFPLPVPILRHLGNPVFHALPHYFHNDPLPLSFIQRLRAIGMYIYDEYMYYTFEEPAMDKLIRKYFGEDVPSVRELARNIALGFVNMVDTKPRMPLVSSIIPVGGMHIPPVQPLNKTIKDFLDGAKDGAVIMSFGSLMRGDGIGAGKVEAVLKVFSRLPQRLVWKYESAGEKLLVKVPSNVMLLSWLPQNDVLAHPNIRLFISHCGGLSTQEAAYHGVPVLGAPFMMDQHGNADQVVSSGMGLKFSLSDLTEETFYGNITELLNNPKYYSTAQRTKSVMQDQQVKPLDRAVFNVEYVIRHRGAPHLRSPLLDLPLASHTLVVDLAIVVALLTLLFLAIVLILLKVLWGCLRPSRTPVNSSKKKD